MAKKEKFYVVWKGHNPGIYDKWNDCKRQIEGFENAEYKSFLNLEQAKEAFDGVYSDYAGKDKRILEFSEEDKIRIGLPQMNSLSVDAACSGNPGILEYRGVLTNSGKEVFRMGPFPKGTINIGEFLALIHGIALLHKENKNIPVYTDSKTAMAWVRKKNIKTKLERNAKTENLFQLVDRALVWLKKNDYKNPILKWQTEFWGEIPADFGRK